MNLFLNVVSKKGILILFDNNRTILAQKNISILGNESGLLLDLLSDFLQSNKLDFSKLKNIVLVNGPGSFTGVRIVSLFVNTLSFIYPKLFLTTISFFDLYFDYPIVKISSKRDLFVKKSKQDIIEVLRNEEFIDFQKTNNIKNIYGEDFAKLKVNSKIDYTKLIKSIKLKKEKQIRALYIKKPSIN